LSIAAKFTQLGHMVSFPFGANQRYDLLVDGLEGEGVISKVQIKTGRYKKTKGIIEFRSCSSGRYRREKGKPYSKKNVDYFGVYCLETSDCYLIPLEEASSTITKLRVDSPKTERRVGVRWAKDYLL